MNGSDKPFEQRLDDLESWRDQQITRDTVTVTEIHHRLDTLDTGVRDLRDSIGDLEGRSVASRLISINIDIAELSLKQDSFAATQESLMAKHDAMAAKQDELAAKQDAMAAKQDELAAKQDAMATKQDAMAADQVIMKAKISGLESDVGTLKTNVIGLRSDMGLLKSAVGALSSNVGEILQILRRPGGSE